MVGIFLNSISHVVARLCRLDLQVFIPLFVFVMTDSWQCKSQYLRHEVACKKCCCCDVTEIDPATYVFHEEGGGRSNNMISKLFVMGIIPQMILVCWRREEG